ncbi:MAG UNVERIFIED_CONTAM: RNA polymerase sigma factor [Planctomycetaceae bacterium]|jgi:RNA polymerase sigma factor (sigma-70 family)
MPAAQGFLVKIHRFDTSLGMLDRVRSGDDRAWSDFARKAAAILSQWARWKRLQAADADDLTHEALLVVISKIHSFKHSGRGSFRAWLRAIAWRCLCEAQNDKENLARPELAERYLRTEDQITDLEEEFDRIQQMELLRSCMLAVQRRVRTQTWEAFQLIAIEGLTGPAAAQQLNMQLDAVHAAKARIQKLLSAEIRRRQNHRLPEN